LLKHSRHDINNKPWAIRAFREVAVKFFKVVRACEEIHRLNIEIRHLHAWLDYKDKQLSDAMQQTARSDLLLVTEMTRFAATRRRINESHHRRLQSIYQLPGFTGSYPACEAPCVEESEGPTVESPLVDEDQ